MSGELSQFEQKSTITPRTTPYVILGAFAAFVLAAVLISKFAPNEAEQDLRDIDKNNTTEVSKPDDNSADNI